MCFDNMLNKALALLLRFPKLPYHRRLIKNLDQQYTLRHSSICLTLWVCGLAQKH